VEFIRNGILVAIAAHCLGGISLLWDKILLRKPATQNLLSYVFWMGAMSVFGIILVFFGFHMPPLPIALLAFASGAFQLVSMYFYYLALKRGEASETLAIMGGFSPAATALAAALLLGTVVNHSQMLGFVLMVAGGFVMFLAEKMNYRQLLPPMLAASVSYGFVLVFQKIAFNHTNFVSGYVFFTLGTFTGSLLLLAPRSWRRQIVENTGSAERRSRFWYLTNRLVDGVGAFLVWYAISLANPAMVEAISAVRYVVIFLGAYVLTIWKPGWISEGFYGMTLAAKAAATGLVTAGLVIVGLRGDTVAYNDSNTTPQATRQAPAQRCQ